jgi:competence protein ComEA
MNMNRQFRVALTFITLVAALTFLASVTGAEKTATNSTAASTAKAKIDINSASKTELETLPGVGPATADAIIAARPFKSVSELKDVKGIGDVRYKEIRPLVTVRANASTKGKGSATGAPASTSQGTSVGKTNNTARSSSQHELGVGADKKAKGQTAEPEVNLNTASKEELESLPGIGPVKAQAIIDNRPYKSVEDVMKVNGIKEGTFAKIKDRITVR